MSRRERFSTRRSVIVTSILTMALVAGAALHTAESAVTESFTYQGRLFDAGVAVNGVYDFEFKLYDRADFASGLQIGPPVIVENVTVWDGLFSVELDFGAAPFDGTELWLQVALRSGSSIGPFTVLDPRQKMTATPFAALALDADRLGGVAASSYSLVGHAHSGSDITSGTVADARIASTLARDSEIMPTVLANDGAGSGLNAEYLGGYANTAFARSATAAKAYGYMSQYTGLHDGAFNVDDVVWNDDLDRYEITITGMYFSIDDVAMVTVLGDAGSCPAGAVPRMGSVSGKLLVYILKLDNTKTECSFHFVVYAGT